MDPRQRVKNYIERHGMAKPERIRRALYNGTGGPVPTSVIREVLAQVSGQPIPTAPSPTTADAPARRTKTRTLADFRAEHDYALKLKRALSDMGEGYVDEHEMKAAAGIPNHVWRRYAELPEFRDNKLKLRDVTYWAKPRVIEQMKEIVGL
jgi:hypothetical protein